MYEEFEFDMEMEQEVAEPEVQVRRTRGERRKTSIFKAIRKRKIDTASGYSARYNNLHQYSKNKVHCSCPLCRNKSKDRDAMGKKFCPTVADIRKLNRLDDSYQEDFLREESA